MQMHAAIRQYKVNDMDTLVSRVDAEFVPRVKGIEGFIGYYVIDGGNGTVVSVTVGETAEAVDASTTAAAEWVRENVADLIEGPPQVVTGEVRVSTQPH
jgi:hypothetical protein